MASGASSPLMSEKEAPNFAAQDATGKPPPHEVDDLPADVRLALVPELIHHSMEAVGESLALALREGKAHLELGNPHGRLAIRAQVGHEIALVVLERMGLHDAKQQAVLAALHAPPKLDVQRPP